MVKNLFTFFLVFLSLKGHADYFIDNHKIKSEWANYYENTLYFTRPHLTLMLAYQYFEMENQSFGKAVDLGAGTGRDTLFLLEKGWEVLALDKEELAIDIILNRVEQNLANLETSTISFSEMNLPENVDLINASFSLPYAKPEEFYEVWEKISSSLRPGGRFCGHFFGENDSWSNKPDLTFLSEDEVFSLFENHFLIEYYQIEEGLFPEANGNMKYWHRYHLVAKKRD